MSLRCGTGQKRNLIEIDLHKGFNKALSSINRGSPWEKFLLLKAYLATDELIAN